MALNLIICPICFRNIPGTAAGSLTRHSHTPVLDEVCAASGMTPVEARARFFGKKKTKPATAPVFIADTTAQDAGYAEWPKETDRVSFD